MIRPAQHAGGRIVAADEAGIARALELLHMAQAIAFPTETVYGLGADAASARAVAEIYRIKRRPAGHPLIVHVTDLALADQWAIFDARAYRLAEALWPGPLTLVLPRRPGAPAHACGAQDSIGLRCPSHPVAARLLAAFAADGGKGIAAPSANRFGRVSPTSAAHVRDDLDGDVALILDGGDATIGLESTIVDIGSTPARLLRPGSIAGSRIAQVLGEPLAGALADSPRVSGMLAAHYAPLTPIEIHDAPMLAERAAALAHAGIAVALWSRRRPDGFDGRWFASPADAPTYGHDLYRMLRRLDALGVGRLLLEQVPDEEAWRAVRDRLGRAVVGSGGDSADVGP